MSKVRDRLMFMSTPELWNMFADGEEFEKTGVVSDHSGLRNIARLYMEDNALSMIVVMHEVWRELALRGK